MDIRGGTGSLTGAMLYKWVEEQQLEDLVTIDLSAMTFIDPVGLTLVAALAERAAVHGHEVNFIAPPEGSSAAIYAARMHLGSCLESIGVRSGLRSVREYDVGDRLFELHRFDPTGFDELADRVYTASRERGIGERNAADICMGLNELMENTVFHSGMAGGWAAMQIQEARGELTFAVSDSGIGLRKSLERSYHIDSDEDAIKLAFRKGVTGTGSSTRGEGLNDLLARVKRGGGVVRAFSGTSAGMSRNDGDIFCRRLKAAYPGTVVYASLKLN